MHDLTLLQCWVQHAADLIATALQLRFVDVPKSQRCQCEPAAPAADRPKRGLLSRVLGRGGSSF